MDYEEVFALVARLETVRLILALAAQGGWEMHRMDVKSAFLNGDLLEEVYVHQSLGFLNPKYLGKVLKLRKAVGMVSRFMESPTSDDWAAIKRIVRYISGTSEYGSKYENNYISVLNLLGYSDRDHAGYLAKRKILPGFCFS